MTTDPDVAHAGTALPGAPEPPAMVELDIRFPWRYTQRMVQLDPSEMVFPAPEPRPWALGPDPIVDPKGLIRVEFASDGSQVYYYYNKGASTKAESAAKPLETSPNSTEALEPVQEHPDVHQHIVDVFERAKEEHFEDGMESTFSRSLLQSVLNRGNDAMQDIDCLIRHNRVSPEVASEALRWLGRIDDPDTRPWRLSLLSSSLRSPSARVRDGALLGLELMEDTRAIPDLRSAADEEAIPELKQALLQVLRHLENA